MTTFLDAAFDFLLLLGAIYGATVAAYFGMGTALTWLNARNPGRRIQPDRDGAARRGMEIRQSLRSILVTSTSLSIGLFVQARGWTPFPPLDLTWWNALPLMLLCMTLFEIWFYTGHRLLHTRWLRRFHGIHHASKAPTPWSNDSFGVVDTAIEQGFYAVITLLVPFPPAILLVHRALDHVNGTMGHCGFEYVAGPTARWPWPTLCTTYHDMHHAGNECNFSNWTSWIDRLCGTCHPDYDAIVARKEKELPNLRLRQTR